MLAIIQARLGSTRLPRKVLMQIDGKPLLSYMVERLKQSKLLQTIVVATPLRDAEEIRQTVGCYTFGYDGNENDVAKRFRHVLTKDPTTTPAAFIRLCADSPLIDPVLVDWMIGQYDGTWLTNTKPRSFPAGQCVEILNSAGFIRGFPVWRMQDGDEEHVTPPFYRLCNWKNAVNPRGDFSRHSMVVDTQEDFDRTAAVIGKMTRPHHSYGWRELVELYES